ncbi:hypothetical protein ACTXOF_14455 [Glutamicibacter arilaitensis]|uniref:hypothetical protein n=1 Tax=Glutamicibacter arilaitensis TaxID=256701 RepID=UPI003FD37EBB
MEIVNERTHRILGYIAIANRQGVHITAPDVNAYGNNPDLRIKKISSITDMLQSSIWGTSPRYEKAETYSQYLVRVRWATDSTDGIKLTKLGKAILKDLNSPKIDPAETGIVEVILDPEDPFAYASALGVISSVENALLIDPYLRLDGLQDIVEFDNVERILVRENISKQESSVLSHAIGALAKDGKNISIGKARDLHDRYVIPAEGNIVMLGTSLNGIGKKISTVTTIGDGPSELLREHYEEVWKKAEIIKPSVTSDIAATSNDNEQIVPKNDKSGA